MKRKGNRARLAVSVTALLLGIGAIVPGAALAQSQTPDQWRWTAVIYGYFPAIGGTITFPTGTTANISVDAHGVISNLKFAAMGILEARKGPWDLFTDVIYADIGGSKSQTRDLNIPGIGLPIGITADANLDVKTTLWTLAGGYRFVSTPDVALDLFVGARNINLKQDLGWNFSADFGPFVGPGRQGSSEVKVNNWDGIVGAKGNWSFGQSHEWFVPYYVDIGTGQDLLTFQTYGGLGYRFHWGELVGVWRYIDYHFSNRNGATMTMNGPAVGVVFHW
jgi:hypothetical protein